MSVRLENKSPGVWLLTMDRPQALNALNQEMLQELEKNISELQKKPRSEVRAVVVTGAGEKAFVAGADIKEMNGLDVEQGMAFAQKGQKVFTMLEELPAAMIAAVNGFALGGGLELALACDFIYAAENAKFGLPEVTLGLIPGFGGTVRLQKTVGRARALEMTLTGEMLPATEALNYKLVNKVLLATELLPAALKTAETIAQRGPVAVAAAKKSILSTAHLDIYKAQEFESESFGELFSSKDMREGTLAFSEKRKPAFKGE